MKYDFGDEEIRSVRLSELLDYMHGIGWSRVSGYGNNASIFRNGDGFEVLVPNREDLSDYVPVVREIFGTLVRVHDNSPVRVYQDVVNQRRDVIRIAAVEEAYEDGMIAPDAASDLFTGAKQLWEYAVKSALEDPAEAADYWHQARFGQTERGSYVVTMLSPPIFLGTQMALDAQHALPPPARKVTDELTATFLQARSLVSELRDSTVLTADLVIGQPVSIRSCEALGKVLNPFGSVNCEVYKTSIFASSRAEPQVTRFTRDDVEYLKLAAEQLKTRELRRPAEASVHGYILRCERREDRDDGKVTLNVLMPDVKGVQTVHLGVQAEDYAKALEWHGMKLRVDAKGELTQESKATWRLHRAKIRRSPSEDW